MIKILCAFQNAQLTAATATTTRCIYVRMDIRIYALAPIFYALRIRCLNTNEYFIAESRNEAFKSNFDGHAFDM